MLALSTQPRKSLLTRSVFPFMHILANYAYHLPTHLKGTRKAAIDKLLHANRFLCVPSQALQATAAAHVQRHHLFKTRQRGRGFFLSAWVLLSQRLLALATVRWTTYNATYCTMSREKKLIAPSRWA